jgi:hypothetical protein
MNSDEKNIANQYGAVFYEGSFLLNGYSICRSISINNKPIQYSMSRIDKNFGYIDTTYHKTLSDALINASENSLALA